MPFCIEIDPSLRRIHTRAYGRVSGMDLDQYYRDLHAHPEFQPDMDELFDLSDATDYTVAAADIREFALATLPHTRQGPPVRVAVVAPSDLAFGMARMYELLQTDSSNRIQVVRSRGEAEDWLAIRVEPSADPARPLGD